MASLGVSHFTANRAEGLVRKGLLCEKTAADEWVLPGPEQGMLTRVADSLPPVPEDAERRARNRLRAEEQKRRGAAAGASARDPALPGPGAVPQGPAQRVLQELVRTAPQGSAQRAPQEPVRTAPQGAAQDVPRGSAQGLPQEGAQGAPSGLSQGVPQQRVRAAPLGTSPRGVSLRLAPKKALLASSSSGGRAAAPPAATGGAPGVATGPPAEVAAMESVGGTAAESAAGGGADSTPPAAPPIAPPPRAVVPPGPQAGEVIDLDADKAKEAETTEGRADAPAAMAVSEAEGVLAPEDAAAAKAAVPEAGISLPVAPAGVTLAAEMEVPTGVPLAAAVATGAQAPEPSADPGVSGVMMSSSTATSESAFVPPSASSVPGAWRGPVLRWTSRDDPPRRLYGLDDAAEWHRWQAMHGGVAQVQAALTSALGVLANTMVPGSQALQEGSREKSDFLRRQRNLWEHYNTERERSRDLTLQLGAAQGAVRDLEGRDIARLRTLLDEERGEHSALRDTGYCAGYTDAKLDEIDAVVTAPAEALAKLLEDEALRIVAKGARIEGPRPTRSPQRMAARDEDAGAAVEAEAHRRGKRGGAATARHCARQGCGSRGPARRLGAGSARGREWRTRRPRVGSRRDTGPARMDLGQP
nr:nascent polypeptide-associated complex subunit alpha, muscle-specific form-like [Setaria viridis]